MRNLRYLFIILSVVFITTLENLYSQNNYNSIIKQEDIIVNKLVNGYTIYIRKKPNTAKLKLRLANESKSYLYVDGIGKNSSILNINSLTFKNDMGEVFQINIPEILYLDNNSVFRLRNNVDIIIESYDINDNILYSSKVIFKINNNVKSIPTITLRNVEKEGNLYAFYLYYSGADNGKYAFYVREGKTNTEYKLIRTSFSALEKIDNSAIILEDTYNKEIGKKLYIKAYFKQLPEDRYLSFNVFNIVGESFTYPIDYVIETTNIKKNETPPPIPSVGEEMVVPTRPVNRVIEQSTNIIIVKQNANSIFIENKGEKIENTKVVIEEKKNNYYDGEAIDNFYLASKAFNTKNNYAKDQNELIYQLKNIIDKYKSEETLDVVMVIDTTESMHPYIKTIKQEIKSIVRNIFNNHKSARVGFLLYRDIKDSYFTKKIDFNNDINKIKKEVSYFYASGGGDKPEPVYEAIQEALETFEFLNDKKLIIVMTDAPAKVIGRANLELNTKTSKEKNVTIELILLSEMKKEYISDDYLYFLNF